MSNEGIRNSATTDEGEDDLFEGEISLGVTLGEAVDGGMPVFQFNEDRYRHTVIIGRTGSGKSNLMQQMEREDIRSGAGCVILAAQPEDALYALSCVPEHRLADVTLLDFSNPEYLPRMNPLDVDVYDRGAVSKAMSDALELLTADCSYEWAGPRFETMLRNGLGLILDPGYPFPRELAELNLLYTDPEHVKAALATCSDRHVFDQWTKVEPSARHSSDYGEVIQWFLAKVGRISSDRVLSHVLGAGLSTASVRDVVEQGGVLVAYVPESRIGAAAARTINKWLVMQLRDAIMTRSTEGTGGWSGLDYRLFEDGGGDDAACDLEPLFVYVDEFSRFATPDFATLLAESRKRNVGFVLGLQTLSQTRTLDIRTGQLGAVEEAIIGNVGSIICYPMGVRDIAILSEHLGVEPKRLASIRRYEPIARLCVSNSSTRPFEVRVGLRPEPDNPTVARRVAIAHVRDGVWVPVEDAACAGAFERVVGMDDGFAAASPCDQCAQTPPATPRELDSTADAPERIGGIAYPQTPDNGLGHAYRYLSWRTGELVTTRSIARASREGGQAGFQTIWVCYKNRRIDHMATPDEWRSELERRVGDRVSSIIPSELLDDFLVAIDSDDESAARWMAENCPEYGQIVARTCEEMTRAELVDD